MLHRLDCSGVSHELSSDNREKEWLCRVCQVELHRAKATAGFQLSSNTVSLTSHFLLLSGSEAHILQFHIMGRDKPRRAVGGVSKLSSCIQESTDIRCLSA